MNTQMTLSQIIMAANNLSVEQQLVLNKTLCDMIKIRRKIQQAVVGAEFSIGQIVQFSARNGATKKIKIVKFNRARTAVVGSEVTETGFVSPGTRWTVANSLCTAV